MTSRVRLPVRIFIRRRTSQTLADSLRIHIARHNWQVLGFATLTFVTAVGLWGALYVGAYWMALVVQTIRIGDKAVAPGSFPFVFGAVAAALILAAWFDRIVTGEERPPDHRMKTEIFLDLVLAIPRATLAIFGNLSAWQWLNRKELQQAAALLERIVRERRVPLHSTPLEIPEERARTKIVFALLILRILDVSEAKEGAYLRLSPFRPPTLHLPNVGALP